MTKMEIVKSIASAFRGRKITNEVAGEIFENIVEVARKTLVKEGKIS